MAPAVPGAMRVKRVLVVDDSAFARKLIRDILDSSGALKVVDTASNGREALSKLDSVAPDVITLDVEMPLMNGIETLTKIMQERPTPVVMLSSLTTKGAEISMTALQLGAVDVVAKPVARGLPQLQVIADALVTTVVAAAHADVRKLSLRPSITSRRVMQLSGSRVGAVLPVVVIASSTGGPRALRYLVPKLADDVSAFYLIVQHLPVGFTTAMARDLDGLSTLTVREAEDNDSPQPGMVFIAPAGKHTAFARSGRIMLTEDPPLWGVRPAADIAMTTAASVFGQRAIGVVLTGMGRDGAHGLSIIKNNGGTTLAEHESSCIIYGMPKVAIESGAAQSVIPLDKMPDAIAAAVSRVAFKVCA